MLIRELIKEADMKMVPSNILGPDGKPSAYHILDDEGHRIRTFNGDQAETAAKNYIKKYNPPTPPTPPSNSGIGNKPNFSVVSQDPKTKSVEWVETDEDGKKFTRKGSYKDYEQSFKQNDPDGYERKLQKSKKRTLGSFIKNRSGFVKGSLIVLVGGTAAYIRIQETFNQNDAVYRSMMENPTLSDQQKQKEYNRATKKNWAACYEDLQVTLLGTLAGAFISAVTYLGYAKYARAAALATGAMPFNWPGLIAFGASAGLTYAIERWLDNQKEEIYKGLWKDFLERGVTEGHVNEESIPNNIKNAKVLSADDHKRVMSQIKQIDNKEPNNQPKLINQTVADNAKKTNSAFQRFKNSLKQR